MTLGCKQFSYIEASHIEYITTYIDHFELVSRHLELVLYAFGLEQDNMSMVYLVIIDIWFPDSYLAESRRRGEEK